MRLLHTSDWHLGRSLHRADLREAQAGFIDHLVGTVRSEKIDAVLVAGDVYDRAIPPVDAVALCEEGLVRLRDAGARVIVISGNHDSARRLGFGSALVDASGVHLRTRVRSLAEPVMLRDRHGPVAVYGVPYLEPYAVRGELPPAAPGAACQADTGTARGDSRGGGDARCGDGSAAHGNGGHSGAALRAPGHAGVLGEAIRSVRADIAARGGVRAVVMAHAWVAGGEGSDSERDISVGGVARVPAALFGGFSYVALGHLHGQQTLAGHLRYSGSPLPYSFSEASHAKGSWLVELGADGAARAERVPAPVPRKLSVLRGTLGELLTSDAYTRHERDFLSVTLTDPGRPEFAMERLRRRFPHVLVLTFEPEGAGSDRRDYRARVAGRGDLAIAAEFVAHVRNTPVTAGERALLAAAFEEVRRAGGEPAPARAARGEPAPARAARGKEGD
ncbi:MAG TPA: exonuclease SbcCD subunit D [Streptosporangiaceae bacterium]|nr:exonuclease SbcCD subunit D [Streptosporangiaceae bacterium]